MSSTPWRVQPFLDRGVIIPAPHAVYIDEAVSPESIAPGVVIHAGSKILGASTSIGPKCVIGQEAPMTLEDCQLGTGVELKGGYAGGATFLDGSNMGSGAHVRAGTLLEEEASGAHTVGLKQTILLPFVTLGSLINFCDVLMAGGTSRKNHSEVGSSYIHFNYTPHQDKATASLVGDVARGVMLNSAPIFLGGQGGLVGPARIAYGCVIPAGTVFRGDALEQGMLLMQAAPASTNAVPYAMGVYGSIRRVVVNNLHYLGNLRALKAWYRHGREPFMRGDRYAQACYQGALTQCERALKERLTRLGQLAEKMTYSVSQVRAGKRDLPAAIVAEQEALARAWPALEATIKAKLKADQAGELGASERQACLGALHRDMGAGYLQAVQGLADSAKAAGTAWLEALVADTVALWGIHIAPAAGTRA